MTGLPIPSLGVMYYANLIPGKIFFSFSGLANQDSTTVCFVCRLVLSSFWGAMNAADASSMYVCMHAMHFMYFM